MLYGVYATAPSGSVRAGPRPRRGRRCSSAGRAGPRWSGGSPSRGSGRRRGAATSALAAGRRGWCLRALVRIPSCGPGIRMHGLESSLRPVDQHGGVPASSVPQSTVRRVRARRAGCVAGVAFAGPQRPPAEQAGRRWSRHIRCHGRHGPVRAGDPQRLRVDEAVHGQGAQRQPGDRRRRECCRARATAGTWMAAARVSGPSRLVGAERSAHTIRDRSPVDQGERMAVGARGVCGELLGGLYEPERRTDTHGGQRVASASAASTRPQSGYLGPGQVARECGSRRRVSRASRRRRPGDGAGDQRR